LLNLAGGNSRNVPQKKSTAPNSAIALVQASEHLQKGCLTARYVVVPQRMLQLVNTVVGAIGHVTARFVSSLDEAYAEISKEI